MIDWLPNQINGGDGPRYLQIVSALERDIASGLLTPGRKLLPQRIMAERLGISVGTVSKAYEHAEKRGLISGEVGRGTFVLGVMQNAGAAARTRSLNLAINAPPDTGAHILIAQALAAISNEPEIKDLLAYLPHQGSFRHRTTIGEWLNRHVMPAETDNIMITHGAQHAIAIALGVLVSSGNAVLAENLTYSGIRALSIHRGYRLRGVLMDEYGLVPEQLDRAFVETGARAVFCMPSLQTPTGSTMPDQRREEIVTIIRNRNAFLIEDDAYGFLCDPPIPPLSQRIPERSFYLVSFAKCLAPGLRIGAMVAPPGFRDRCINAIRSTGWMATPIMAEVVSRLIENGRIDEQIRSKRDTAARRYAMALRILDGRISKGNIPAFHVWLQMPTGRTISSLIAQAATVGITIAAPDVLQSSDQMSNGVRLCLGALAADTDAEAALLAVRSILSSAETMSFV
jgi:DNA-binding transcriptional MocR family regulator